MIGLIGFDADDTLWHDVRLFRSSVDTFTRIIGAPCRDEVERAAFRNEIRNLRHFGYGVKGFTLSLIETALDLTDEQVTGVQVREIIELGKEMMHSPVELVAGAREAVERLSQEYRLALITKGDLFHQEAKVARSGLGDLFDHLEIVSRKDAETYGAILRRCDVAPGEFLMVGNSIPSDIRPVLDIGGWAAHIPYHGEWAHDSADERERGAVAAFPRFLSLSSLTDLPAAVERLSHKNKD